MAVSDASPAPNRLRIAVPLARCSARPSTCWRSSGSTPAKSAPTIASCWFEDAGIRDDAAVRRADLTSGGAATSGSPARTCCWSNPTRGLRTDGLGFGPARWCLPRCRRGSRRRGAAAPRRRANRDQVPEDRDRLLLRTGRQAEIVEVKGSVELAPLTGLAEAIVDLTATGTTLRENGLVVRERIAVATARLIANRSPTSCAPPRSMRCWSDSVDLSGSRSWRSHGVADELRALVPAAESVRTRSPRSLNGCAASGTTRCASTRVSSTRHGATPAALRCPEAELDTADRNG